MSKVPQKYSRIEIAGKLIHPNGFEEPVTVIHYFDGTDGTPRQTITIKRDGDTGS